MGEHWVEREIGGALCRERDWGNTVMSERLGNTVLRERLGNTVLRERVGNSVLREIGGTLC